MLLECIIYGLVTFSVPVQPKWETFARFEVLRVVVLMKIQIFSGLMSSWEIGTQVFIPANGVTSSSKILLIFASWQRVMSQKTWILKPVFSIVVIRNEVSLNYCIIIILLYFHLTAWWYKKLKRGWVTSIWARTSSTSSENHEAFCFATVETWSLKRPAYKNRCHTAVSTRACPAGEVWWPHSDLLTAGLTSGN